MKFTIDGFDQGALGWWLFTSDDDRRKYPVLSAAQVADLRAQYLAQIAPPAPKPATPLPIDPGTLSSEDCAYYMQHPELQAHGPTIFTDMTALAQKLQWAAINGAYQVDLAAYDGQMAHIVLP